MADLLAHPAIPLLAAAALAAGLRGAARTVVVLAAPVAALVLALAVPAGAQGSFALAGVAVVPFAVDALSRLFASTLAIAALGGALYALDQPARAEMPAALLHAAGAVGVACAGDLLAMLVFGGLMTIGATIVVWSAGTRRAYGAGMRFAMLHAAAGSLLLLGVTAHYIATGTVAFAGVGPGVPGYWAILAGLLVGAAALPVSAWVADTLPQSSWSGGVFLAVFTTTAAACALLRTFAGEPLLAWVGLAMLLYGIVYALLAGDVRRILAYGIVSQAGSVVAAAGLGTPMAVNGAAASALAHGIGTGLLVMAAGAVLRATGRSSLSELGGLGRSMPLTAACAIVGALSFASLPLTAGFVSRAMIVEAAGAGRLPWVWLALAAGTSAGAVAIALRFVWLVFFHRDAGLRATDPPLPMRVAMVLLAALCIVPGLWYEPLYRLLPFPVDFVPYTGWRVVSQLQLVLAATVAFFALLPLLRRTPTITLDIDWLWRRALPAIVGAVLHAWQATTLAWSAWWSDRASALATQVRRTHGPEGILARTWSVRSMGLWMLVLLLALLLLGFLG